MGVDVFLIFLTVRIASVFLVQTYFVPDEYWQSLEVAHKIVFDYGYLTWEWSKGIRSYVPPLVFAFLYKILQILHLDFATNLIYGPRILQAVLSAYSDLCFYKWSGSRKWGVFCLATSWFWFYTGSRTLINTLECTLTTIALSKFPWPGKGIEDTSSFIWIVSLLFAIRPTCAILWVPLCIYHLLISKKSLFTLLLGSYLPIGLSVLTISTVLDSLAHGSFVISVYEFLKFNLLQDIASFYGREPWHWYLSSGFPAVCGIQLLPFVIGTLVVLKNRRVHPNELIMLGTIIFTIAVYSCLPHKEFRFILPLLPLVLYVSSRFLSAWSRKSKRFHRWLVAAIILIGNGVPAWYFSMVHQRGPLDVMEPLRDISTNNPSNTSLIFLMPCHSTPMYSHIHVNVTARYLTCLPNFDNKDDYLDEADQFYLDPVKWFRKDYPPNGTLPSHIVCFDHLVPYISEILSRYERIGEIFNAFIKPASRVGRFIHLYERVDFDKVE